MPASLGRHIPYGVSEPSAAAAEVAALRERLGAVGEEILVGMVSATADPEKGHDVFLTALAEAGPRLRAVVVGPHPERGFKEEIGRLGLGGRIMLEGPVSAATVGAYLCAIDVLVVPSTAFESLPLVVLEAMAAGKPVFASRLSGIPEAIVEGETGYLFEPGAVGELAELLREASATPDRLVRMGLAARERWRAMFSRGAMVTSILALYEELHASRRQRVAGNQ